jgi:hypothetical protein
MTWKRSFVERPTGYQDWMIFWQEPTTLRGLVTLNIRITPEILRSEMTRSIAP